MKIDKDFEAMTPEAQKDLAKMGMWKQTEDLVNKIARNRRVALIAFDIPNEEFDERLDEICERAFKRYQNMDHAMIAFEMMVEQVRSGQISPDDIDIVVEE